MLRYYEREIADQWARSFKPASWLKWRCNFYFWVAVSLYLAPIHFCIPGLVPHRHPHPQPHPPVVAVMISVCRLMDVRPNRPLAGGSAAVCGRV